MSATIQQIGKRLCARRNQMNLTQEQLAERANVTAQTISYAELGKKAIKREGRKDCKNCHNLAGYTNNK